MALAPGTRLGPYEIQSPLGAGGMGEVFRARDTRLERVVAIKVLPSHLSENPDARQRFDREARTISALNHANICTLFDVGHQDGTDYLVMEYLEGETLADRLRKGPLPIQQLIKYGIEICDGLDRAHRSGIVHRDLKPGNVMLTKSGAKLMDFGLAKASVASSAAASNLTVTLTTPAQSHPLTAQGTVVGTFQYMAPEQVEGKESDSRADIFALGAVLYEMATAKRAFEGKSAASTMAAILERDPAPISTIAPTAPPALDHLVKTCLAKDPDERWQTAHDVKLQLKHIADGSSVSAMPAVAVLRRKHRPLLAWGIAAVLAVAAIAALAMLGLRSGHSTQVLRIEIVPPEKMIFNLSGDTSGPAAISPDGKAVVFSAKNPGGFSQLFVRSLDSLQAQPLPGTEEGMFPFWSPDSRTIGFFTSGKLKRLDLDAHTPVTLCDSVLGRGASWGADGTILAALSYNTGISRISASGGDPTVLTKVDNTTYSSHRWPFALPDGKHFLYTAVNHTTPNSLETGIFFASMDGKENRFLLHTLANAVYAGGNLIYMREGTAVAQPFDPSSGKFTGEPRALQENIQLDGSLWHENLSISQTGLMVYASAISYAGETVNWYDRSGKNLGQVGEAGAFQDLELSPDGKRFAYSDVNTAAATIWVQDIASGVKSKITYNGGVTRSPIWSPDGSRIAYVANQGDKIEIKSLAGGAPEETLVTANDQTLSLVSDWSRDGRYVMYQQGNGLRLNLKYVPVTGDRTPKSYANGSSHEWQGMFSPDGRWVVYMASDNGQPQVFVAPFPWTGEKYQISTGNGAEPRWRADGKEIYYWNFAELVAVEVDGSKPAFAVGKATKLFPFSFRGLGREFAVTRDGQRFLIITQSGGASQPLTLVQNWTEQLSKK